jgi:hypothetical protein
MTDRNEILFHDMVEFVDQTMRFNITEQLLSTTPIQAMCTLAACIASITSMTTDVVPLAHHNIDEMSSFAKELVRLIIEEINNKKGESSTITKH